MTTSSSLIFNPSETQLRLARASRVNAAVAAKQLTKRQIRELIIDARVAAVAALPRCYDWHVKLVARYALKEAIRINIPGSMEEKLDDRAAYYAKALLGGDAPLNFTKHQQLLFNKYSKITSIKLTRAEGLISECYSTQVDSFREANLILTKWRASAPAHGYHKIDFTINWLDGGSYRGCYLLARFSDLSLRAHIAEQIKYFPIADQQLLNNYLLNN